MSETRSSSGRDTKKKKGSTRRGHVILSDFSKNDPPAVPKEVKLHEVVVFPAEVADLLREMHLSGFFTCGLLVGSWVLVLYKAAFGITSPMKTYDIDFLVDVANTPRVDLEQLILNRGYLPVRDYQTGLQKFTKDTFEIEFIVHRRGSDDRIVTLSELHVTATPLPFMDILFHSSLLFHLDGFSVHAPCPEAFFFHKLLIAQRRISPRKKANDLAQCRALSDEVDSGLVKKIAAHAQLSSASRKKVAASCDAIGVPLSLVYST